jgi:hypothetical protein
MEVPMFRSIAVISRKTNALAKRLAQPFSKRNLLEAAHVMGPTLTALLFMGASSAVAHAQGTMDFSGATTLMTFKTFAIYAGAVICFGGLIFAGIRMMSGRFQDAIPGLFRRAVWRRGSGMGCRMDRQSYRPDNAVGGVHDQARRTVTNQSGAESAEGQAGPRPHSMDGDRIRLRNGFPRGFRLVAMLAFPALATAAWLIVRKHPKMFRALGP